jgi:hypothetical protein
MYSENVQSKAGSGRLFLVGTAEIRASLTKEINPENNRDNKGWVSTIDSWVQYMFAKAFPGLLLLNKTQELYLLEDIIKQLIGNEFPNTSNISEIFYKTRALLKGAKGDLNSLTPETHDQKIFKSTLKKYEKLKKERDWYSLDDAYKLVTNEILIKGDDLPNNINHFPFNNLKKTEEDLINACKVKGVVFEEVLADNKKICQPLKKPCINTKQEVKECVNFIKHLLTIDESKNICITSPILDSITTELHTKILEEFSTLITPINEVCYTSEIKALTEYSDYNALKNIIEYIFELSDIDLSEEETNIFTHIASTIDLQRKTNTIDLIQLFVTEIFETLGLYSNKNKTQEYIIEIALKCVDKLESFKFETGKFDANEIVKQYLDILGKESIEYICKPLFNIHILPPEHLDGKNFDLIWMLNSNSDHYPTLPSKAPLISSYDNRRLKLNELNEGFILAKADETNRIIESAYEFIYSYSIYDEDRELLEPTILPHADELYLAIKTPTKPNRSSREIVDDTYSTELRKKGKCPGGTRYIELHNQCPFMSTYIARYPKTLKKVDDVFKENNARGNLIHEFLEYFWKKLNSTEELRALSLSKFNLIVKESLNKAIENTKDDSGLEDWFFSNEVKIIKPLLIAFLEIEKKRNFEIVSIEKLHYLTFEDLVFTVFADRIEKETYEADNTVVELIIVSDHKSGEVTASDWLKEPIQKPQVPIYTQIPNIDGAVFNVLNSKETTYKGVVNHPNPKELGISTPRGLKHGWEVQKELWAKDINESVKSMKTGFSHTKPFKKLVCTRCELSNVCRIDANETT